MPSIEKMVLLERNLPLIKKHWKGLAIIVFTTVSLTWMISCFSYSRQIETLNTELAIKDSKNASLCVSKEEKHPSTIEGLTLNNVTVEGFDGVYRGHKDDKVTVKDSEFKGTGREGTKAFDMSAP